MRAGVSPEAARPRVQATPEPRHGAKKPGMTIPAQLCHLADNRRTEDDLADSSPCCRGRRTRTMACHRRPGSAQEGQHAGSLGPGLPHSG